MLLFRPQARGGIEKYRRCSSHMSPQRDMWLTLPFGSVWFCLCSIQTFPCGGSRLPFGSGAIPFRETLVWRPWFLLFAGFVGFSVGCSVARGFLFLVGFRVCPIFVATCHFRFRALCVFLRRPWDAYLGRPRACLRRHSRTSAGPRAGSD